MNNNYQPGYDIIMISNNYESLGINQYDKGKIIDKYFHDGCQYYTVKFIDKSSNQILVLCKESEIASPNVIIIPDYDNPSSLVEENDDGTYKLKSMPDYKEDIGSSLTADEIHDIEVKLFTEKLSPKIDEIIQNRINNGVSLTHDILFKIAEIFTNKYLNDNNDYKDSIINSVKKYISEEPVVSKDSDDSFYTIMGYKICDQASKYIESHPEDIENIMKSRIKEIADQITETQLMNKISYSLNNIFKEIISSIDKSSNNDEPKSC